MTRETKIGLLVGLAFIIIVGILLTEPMSHANELPQAQLPRVAADVRTGNGLPTSSSPPVVTPTPDVRLESPVPTAQEAHRRPGVSLVTVGPQAGQRRLTIDGGAGPSHPTPVAGSPRPQDTGLLPVTHVDDTVAPTPGDGGAGSSGSAAVDPRRRPVQGMGEQLVDSDLQGRPLHEGSEGMAWREAPPVTPVAMKSYEVVAGDTLSKLAGRFMGGNTKANRQAIIDANPSLKEAPDRLIAGETYKIPVAAKPAAAVAASAALPTPSSGSTPTASRASEPSPTVARSPEPAPSAAPAVALARPADHFYVVQPGDNLTRIAVAQLGDARAVAAIKELNKDVLKGGDTLMPNMKLRMPAPPIASASQS